MTVRQSDAIALHGKELTTVANFDVAAGDTIPFVLTYGASHLAPPKPIDPEALVHQINGFVNFGASR